MHMLGRKKGMMTISCRIDKDPFLWSSKWCQAVLVITRITKLMGMLRLKSFWMSVNGREMYAHSETEKRGNKCYRCYIISNTVFSYQTTEKSPSILYSPSIFIQKEQNIFATPWMGRYFFPAHIQKGVMNSIQSMLSYWMRFFLFLKTGFQEQEANIWK